MNAPLPDSHGWEINNTGVNCDISIKLLDCKPAPDEVSN